MQKLLKIIVLTVVLQAFTVTPENSPEVIEFARKICNASEEEIQARIVGGEDATGIIKYQLLIQSSVPGTGKVQQCGASAINEHYALTAAHCVVDSNGNTLQNVDLYGGVHHIAYNKDVINTWQQREASQVIVHQKYNSKLNTDDIAILKVSKPFNFRDGKVSPIELPTKAIPLDGKALISGWGCASFNKPCEQNLKLKRVHVPLWSKENCKTAFVKALTTGDESQQTPDFMAFVKDILRKTVCAGGEHKGSCNGDSGGPLVVMQNGSSVIIGITSFTYRLMCGCDGVPAVYTEVLSYLDWIKENTGDQVPEPPPSPSRPPPPPPSYPPSGFGPPRNSANDLYANLVVYIIWLLIQFKG